MSNIVTCTFFIVFLSSANLSISHQISLLLREVENLKKPYTPREVHVQVTHSMPPQKIEIFKSMDDWAEQNILVHLKPVERCWQPQEASSCSTSWAVWTRAWTAEENRHGDLLNKYLYLCGRVDMRQIEKTIQYLIGSGMDLRTENSPYLGFIYTSFQERATFISHENTARLAKELGDLKLAQICGTIASDEKRHETAYTKIVEKLFEIDPDGTVLAFADMMRKKISMPAHLMFNGQDDHLFEHFSAVAQRLGVYTARDYADILEFLVGRWKVSDLTGLSGEGRKAQEYVCGLPPRIRRLEERAQGRAKEVPAIPFSWIFDRQVKL
ncbi:hypothetical protein RJ639_018166 [Escallonia herrerae]|uniref:Acyl-[acyl-carrier-protein] desaturase n=1 Tax=Escallonia herrerae TaxID=1293975 RepID=A0AA88V899_9ASTE|nr:hypothetical protein RJ639_018166 [Escallonia herrerae]